ncbi:MAG: hypothetical protein R6U32_00635 [Candidatus Woesearchaeota archaeon]
MPQKKARPRKCIKCPKKAYHNNLCRKHFIQQIEARVKKEIRQKQPISRDDILIMTDPLSRHLLRKSLGGMPVRTAISGKNLSREEKERSKKVLLWTLDDEIIDFLMFFFGERPAPQEKGKMHKDRKRENDEGAGTIRPFRQVKDDELEKYAGAAGIKFKKKKRSAREEEIKKAINRIDRKHKETRYSLLKSVEEMKALRESSED